MTRALRGKSSDGRVVMKAFSPRPCPPQHKQGAGKQAERKLEKNVATIQTSTDLRVYLCVFCPGLLISILSTLDVT